MSFSSLMSLSEIATIFDDSYGQVNSSETAEATCDYEISGGNFYNYMLVPAIVEILVLALTMTRKHKFQGCLWGRPGLVNPMDIFEMRNRISYMAAFGSIAYLCSEVVLNSKYVITYNGPVGYRVFVIILSVVVYGIDYFPVFAAISIRSILSYLLGCLHVWTFTVIAYYETFYCHDSLGALYQFLFLIRALPKLVCLTYLSVIMPYRLATTVYEAILEKTAVADYAEEPIDKKLQDLRESRLGRHIQKNFVLPRPRKIVVLPGIKGKIKGIVKPILKDWIYKNNSEFKYSARFLSTVGVAFILVYKLTVELLIFLVSWIDLYLYYLTVMLDYIGWSDDPYDTDGIRSAREMLYIAYYLLDAYRSCIITCTTVEFVLGVLLLLHVTSSYRKYLLALHKGKTVHIPPRDDKSNASIVVSTMRYSGYQIGYTAWAYLIQWLLLLLVCVVLATIVIMYQNGLGYIITDKIVTFWSLPVSALAISLTQLLVTKFCFLQERGEYLALDNRRAFFIFSYFMFYYNIFLGLVSCLLRILKAIILGALFLGRLDHSTLPRRFQLMDPGFDAYVGFLHMENAQRHPVVLMFLSILQVYVPLQKESTHDSKDDNEGSSKKHVVVLALMDKASIRGRKARHRWHLVYTLHNNPHLRQLRKRALRAYQEKLEAGEAARKAKKGNCKYESMESPEVEVLPSDVKVPLEVY